MKKKIPIVILTALAFGSTHAGAAIVLYSTTFGGSSGNGLAGQSVDTSGASAAQHAQYGTSAAATWSSSTEIKANGGVVWSSGSMNAGATLDFTPQNGYVYTLTMTTDVSFGDVAANSGWYAAGFFMQPGYAGNINTNGGATVWTLTRSGDTGFDNQAAHYDLTGGAGNIGSASLAPSAPSTVTIVLDTTGGTGDWSADYYIGAVAPANLLASVADLGAVDIESVGIGANLKLARSGTFQSFELSVIPEPSVALLGSLGMLVMLRRRR